MIPQRAITAWRYVAPWFGEDQVEQDLILSRAICALYHHPVISENLVFRGGTALHKLFFDRAGRYSEDLDFVQAHAQPIGDTVSSIRECLDPWLGNPKWKQNQGRFTLYYRFETEAKPVVNRKLKIEINTREHFKVLPLVKKVYSVENSWFSGSADVLTYALEELMGTKMRALYQRKKGRDLYDYWFVKKNVLALNNQALVDVFKKYIAFSDQIISRAEYEKNIFEKRSDPVFNAHIVPLLTAEYAADYDIAKAYQIVLKDFVSQLPGEAWKREC